MRLLVRLWKPLENENSGVGSILFFAGLEPRAASGPSEGFLEISVLPSRLRNPGKIADQTDGCCGSGVAGDDGTVGYYSVGDAGFLNRCAGRGVEYDDARYGGIATRLRMKEAVASAMNWTQLGTMIPSRRDNRADDAVLP